MDSVIHQLESLVPGGYTAKGPVAAEPTAWAALALAAADRSESAERAAQFLTELQLRNGSVPVTGDNDGPHWTTSLAVLAWQEIDASRFASNIHRGVEWLLGTKGKTNPRNRQIGHNTMLIGWSWAEATHSWLEPTAFATMALTATGYQGHARTREAVEILVDRLLPTGGCNYGNTEVLGQTLLPHLQPSGVVLWALAGQSESDPRIEASLDYLAQEIKRPTGTASLAYALIALSAWNRRPSNAETLITEALHRATTHNSTYKLALLKLASPESLPETLNPIRRTATRHSDDA